MSHVGEFLWLQLRSKNYMSWWTLQLQVKERQRVMHSCELTLQVVRKQTIKPATSCRKTPLCNHLYMLFSTELYCHSLLTFYVHFLRPACVSTLVATCSSKWRQFLKKYCPWWTQTVHSYKLFYYTLILYIHWGLKYAFDHPYEATAVEWCSRMFFLSPTNQSQSTSHILGDFALIHRINHQNPFKSLILVKPV